MIRCVTCEDPIEDDGTIMCEDCRTSTLREVAGEVVVDEDVLDAIED
jgi:hypothetical protein